METLNVTLSWSGDNFVASAVSPEKDVIIATAKTYNKVKEEFAEAFDFHFEDAPQKPVYEFENDITATLKLLENTLTRAAISQYTGINRFQLGHYLQGVKKPKPQTAERIKKGIKKIQETISMAV